LAFTSIRGFEGTNRPNRTGTRTALEYSNVTDREWLQETSIDR